MLCSSTLGEASFDASKLTSVGFCTLLECLIWWLRPRYWDNSPVEGLEVFDLDFIPCTDAGSYIIPMGAAQESYPGGRSWGAGSSESSCRPPLVRSMLDYSLRCHSFEIVKCSCVSIFECFSTRFSPFSGTMPFLM